MVVSDASIHNIMGGMESTAGVRLHNHRRKLKQRFDIIKKLGQGTYGKVQLGINKETGEEVAIKTIKKAKIETEADLIRIRREIQIMSSVQHPNIIHIYEVFENREKMVLVMEYAAGGELYDYLSERKVLVEEEARRIFRQIATAVYYCHKHKICHRDLKLENILLDEHGSAKIADFGLSNVFDDQRLLNTFCGSPLYASPEIVKGTPYHGPEVDCWSLGVLLYTLVYGAMPFDGSNFKRLVKQISHGDYFEPKKPSPASPLIRAMLTVTPSRRADIEKICSHWWVNEGYDISCLEVAEELACQTPVRLDLLLALAPPGPSVGSDKLVVTNEQGGEGAAGETIPPARCHSMGSIMELDHTGYRRAASVVDSLAKDAVKRKLEAGVSTDEANRGSGKKKDRSRRTDRARSTERQRSRSRSKTRSHLTPEQMELDGDTPTATRNASEETVISAMNVAVSSADTIVEGSPSRESKSKTDVPVERSSTRVLDKPPEKEKVKVKKKKKVSNSVASPSEVAESLTEIKVPESSKDQQNEINSIQQETTSTAESSDLTETNPPSEKLEDNSLTEELITATDKKDDVSNTSESKAIDIPNKSGIQRRRSKGESPRVGSSSERSSGTNTPEEAASPPSKPMERRRSKIFETAEKFNNLLSANNDSSTEKPKKVFIPGVKVSDAKRAFERKSSLPTSAMLNSAKLPSKKSLDQNAENLPSETCVKCTPDPMFQETTENKSAVPSNEKVVNTGDSSLTVTNNLELSSSNVEKSKSLDKATDETSISSDPPLQTESKMKKVKEGTDVINNSVSDDTKKGVAGDSKKKTISKPPVPISTDIKARGKTVGASPPTSPLDSHSGKKLVRVQVAPNDIRLATIQVSSPETNKFTFDENTNIKAEADVDSSTSEVSDVYPPEDLPKTAEDKARKKSSKVEITLKSATLPRRRTSKAEIQMTPPPPPVEYKTEVEHMVSGVAPSTKLRSQRSEVAFPVSAAPEHKSYRSSSLEPESGNSRTKPREHIIPIQVERENENIARPPVPPFQQQRSMSQRSGSLSRQSTQDSDTESIKSVGPEPIRKSPREFIIPIAMEGGGYVTPRAGSLEPGTPEDTNVKLKHHNVSRARRMSSLLSDASEDEGFNSPFGTLHRHRNYESDTGEEDRGFHMHRLRSSRPTRKTIEHNDSLSSAEEDDDDDGFEILTAESLFSTLLSRVRSLTQRLNVEEGMRPGFPSSRLLSQLTSMGNPSSSNLWGNMYGRTTEPLSRRLSDTSRFTRSFSRDRESGPAPWRRSTSRDVSDTDSVYSESNSTASTLPRASVRVTVHVPRGGGGGQARHTTTATTY